MVLTSTMALQAPPKSSARARTLRALEPTPSDDPHRDRLLAGLAESIREKGLAGTQISDIVRHARASRRTFYQCFPDKETCFAELAEALTSAVLHGVESAVDVSAPWAVQVDESIVAYLDLLDGDPAMAITFSSDLPMLGARGVAIQRSAIERFAELLVRLVDSEAMRGAGLPPISLEKAVMLVGGMHEAMVRAVGRDEPVKALAPVAKDVIKAVLEPARG
jgi:AcrR family transcriptional regulator